MATKDKRSWPIGKVERGNETAKCKPGFYPTGTMRFCKAQGASRRDCLGTQRERAGNIAQLKIKLSKAISTPSQRWKKERRIKRINQPIEEIQKTNTALASGFLNIPKP
ncbi:MAG: hypothetical protein CAK90_00230 [Spartobacteria bacterium AMD-G4]|nr:MAG: hypothetical protein CAK90_00230 [Spartobacteria bacterium AMD-G4]